MENKKAPVHLFFRKKTQGFNSIEVVFGQLIQYDLLNQKRLRTYLVPFKGISMLNLLKNLIYCFRKRGTVNHISGDIHYAAMALGRNTLLTVHDVQSILNHPNGLKRFFLTLLWFTIPVRVCKRISFISDFSRKEFLKKFPGAEKKTVVISNPAPKIPEEVIRHRKEFIRKSNYRLEILHVGTKWNKNLERVLLSVTGLNYLLHIVGKLSADQRAHLKQNGVSYKNYTDLPYTELLKLYASVDVVNFPSLYEGFGMPILEAQGVGVPVIVSNRCAMPEIVGEGGIIVDPENVEEMRQALVKMEANDHREILVQKGRENVKRYAVEKIYKQYEAIYDEMAS